jgi:hypothetical protein
MMSPFFEARYLVSEALEISHTRQIVPLSGLDISADAHFLSLPPKLSETGDDLIHHSKDVQQKGRKDFRDSNLLVPNSLFNRPK